MDKRTKFLIIRLRSQEKKKLFEYANSVDTSVSVLIRKLIRVTITKNSR